MGQNIVFEKANKQTGCTKPSNLAASLCDQIVKQIKNSGLHFLITETSYKMEIKIRKKLMEPSATNPVKSVEQQLEMLVESLNNQMQKKLNQSN